MHVQKESDKIQQQKKKKKKKKKKNEGKVETLMF